MHTILRDDITSEDRPFDGDWFAVSQRQTVQLSDQGIAGDDLIRRVSANQWVPVGGRPVYNFGTKPDASLATVTRIQVDGHAHLDFQAHPSGPDIGNQFRRSIGSLVSLSRSTDQLPSELHYIDKGTGRVYQGLPSPRAPPTYIAATLVGNTFCRSCKVGFTSFHFERLNSVYISYEHPETDRLPPLDKRAPVPPRVYFHNVKYDPDKFIFRGSILWQDDYRTTWQGVTRSDYEMKFDSPFMCILHGHMTAHTIDSGQVRVSTQSLHGKQGVYINAALYQAFLTRAMAAQGVPSSSSSTSQTSFQHRLEDPGALREYFHKQQATF